MYNAVVMKLNANYTCEVKMFPTSHRILSAAFIHGEGKNGKWFVFDKAKELVVSRRSFGEALKEYRYQYHLLHTNNST
jgi:hypothetical protein